MGSDDQQTPPADETPSVPQQQSLTLFTTQAEERIRRVWLDDQWWFSIIDVIAVLTDSANPRRYWTDMKGRIQDEGFVELLTKCHPLKLTAPDGKLYETQCANFATLVSLVYALPALRRRADRVPVDQHVSSETCGIYAIVNAITQEQYIGSSSDIAARFVQHTALLRRGKHHALRLQEAWDTYGEEAFRFVVLEHLATTERLEEREQQYIDETLPVYNAAQVARNRLSLPLVSEKRVWQVITLLYEIQGSATNAPLFRMFREAITYGLIKPGPKFTLLTQAEASGISTWEDMSDFIQQHQQAS